MRNPRILTVEYLTDEGERDSLMVCNPTPTDIKAMLKELGVRDEGLSAGLHKALYELDGDFQVSYSEDTDIRYAVSIDYNSYDLTFALGMPEFNLKAVETVSDDETIVMASTYVANLAKGIMSRGGISFVEVKMTVRGDLPRGRWRSWTFDVDTKGFRLLWHGSDEALWERAYEFALSSVGFKKAREFVRQIKEALGRGLKELDISIGVRKEEDTDL